METNDVEKVYLLSDDEIPNNPALPLLFYHGGIRNRTASCANVFKENNWTNAWRNGVFDYHHYHSNTHEVLGIVSGTACILFGGENGRKLEVKKGDTVVIPAGVAHKKESSSEDFQVIGAYPNRMTPDLKTGKADERPVAQATIKNVPLPTTDPLQGRSGPLIEIWSNGPKNK
ncbi:MAG: cupin domain-containing protein [Anaerobacillus sp.]